MFRKVKKIRTKILLPSLIVLFAALITTGGLSAYLSYNSTLKTLNQTMTETITAASSLITAELKTYKTILSELAGLVQEADANDVLKLLDAAKERNGFDNISITNSDGIVIDTQDDVSQYDFFKTPRDQGTAYVSEPSMNADQKSMSVFISAPIISKGGFDGIIFVGLDARFLSEIVKNISVGETGTTAIIDKNGSTIAYHDLPTVLMAYNTNKEAKTDPKLERLAALEREVMAGKSGFGPYSYDGVDKFMAYAPVNDTNGWGMYVTVAQSEFMNNTNMSIRLCVIAIIVFLILASFLLAAVARSISRPVIEVEQAAIEMAKGNYDINLTYESFDETGSLADSMRQMIATTKSIILDTSRGLTEIADGNFDVSPQVKYIGVFGGIENALAKIITDLSRTMSLIKVSSEQVSSGSKQVSSGAQALAQGAAEQASTVQELSASINEVTVQIKENALNAASASSTVSSVGETIRTSNEQMSEMMGAMSDISASSSQISKIIKTIEDIAFQTNILALNAAVEAARAGAAGKGFAVVADEVRNLATKSSEAAKQTNVLIEGSVKSVGNGVKIANETAKSLSEVVSGAQQITDLITKISQASAEQSNSISQINLGIDQIASVVQTNSATSEESAAASEELNGQSNIMKDMVSVFRLKSDRI